MWQCALTSRKWPTALLLAGLTGVWPTISAADEPSTPNPPPMAPAAQPSSTVENGQDAAFIDLYTQGRALLKAGNWEAGCAKIDAARAMKETTAVMINVGDCLAHRGALAAAFSAYTRARALNTDRDRRDALEAEIKERLTELGPRLPRLKVSLETQISGATVKQDGQLLGPGALGTDLPVEVGAHEVTAEAPGRVPFRVTVTLREKETQTVVVRLLSEQSSARRYAGTIGLGVTAVALGGVTAALGGWTVSTHPQIVTECARGEAACKAEASALQTRAMVTNVFLGLSIAAAAGAGVVFLAVERPAAKKVQVGLYPGGLAVGGNW